MTYEKMMEVFKSQFTNMELYSNGTWNNVGKDSCGRAYFGWTDSFLPEDYYIFVYLKTDGWMLVTYAFPTGDGGAEEFEPGAYEKVKDFVLNFMNVSEQQDREEDYND